jgi:hypothetical protein
MRVITLSACFVWRLYAVGCARVRYWSIGQGECTYQMAESRDDHIEHRAHGVRLKEGAEGA